MTRFIEKNDFRSRNVSLFGTSGGGKGKEVDFMEGLLDAKDASVKGKFFCPLRQSYTVLSVNYINGC